MEGHFSTGQSPQWALVPMEEEEEEEEEVCWPGWNGITTRTNCYIYIYIYIYSTPPDDGLQICPKHVEVD